MIKPGSRYQETKEDLQQRLQRGDVKVIQDVTHFRCYFCGPTLSWTYVHFGNVTDSSSGRQCITKRIDSKALYG